MATSQWPDFLKSPQKAVSLTPLHPGNHSTCLPMECGSDRQSRKWQVKLETREKGELIDLEDRVRGWGEGSRSKRPKPPTLL